MKKDERASNSGLRIPGTPYLLPGPVPSRGGANDSQILRADEKCSFPFSLDCLAGEKGLQNHADKGKSQNSGLRQSSGNIIWEIPGCRENVTGQP